MAKIVITWAARRELAWLIRTHGLPADTKERFVRAVGNLHEFPELGSSLAGRWRGYRFVLGPWRWMIIVYSYDANAEVVVIATIQDSRSQRSPTAEP